MNPYSLYLFCSQIKTQGILTIAEKLLLAVKDDMHADEIY